jgi:succinoglycan biosynthesis transport protein ExoP
MQKSEVRPSASPSEAKLHFLDYWRVIRVRFGIVLLSFLLVVITAGITTYFMPKKYRSSATLELRLPGADKKVFEPSAAGADPYFVPTQFEIIQSKEVLYPVIDSLDLPHRWAIEGSPLSRNICFEKVRQMLGLRPVRSTNLLALTATSTNPQEALLIANAVVQSYQDVQIANIRGLSSQTRLSIERDLVGQREKVDALNRRLQEMRRTNPNLVDPNIFRAPTNNEDPNQSLIYGRQTEVDKYSTQIAALRSQLGQVEKLKGDELMRALSTLDLPDPIVQRVLPLYQETIASEANLVNSGVGPNHPKIKALKASREVFVKQLSDQIDSIKHSLGIRLEIAEKTLQNVNQQLANAKKEQLTYREGSAEYNELKEEYLKAKTILEATEQRRNMERVDENVSRVPVIIWDKAELPANPSSPNVLLNMILGVLVGIATGIGLAFFIEYLDTSVKTMDDVESLLGVPVLAIVPKNIRLLHKQAGDIPDAEAYRILRTNIEFNRKSADANTISMVSGGPGEGKSTTLANLAFTCAQGGYSVLIVDADLRRPTQHKIFEVSNTVGLTNYLTTNVSFEDVIMATSVENLYLMPSGILPADAVGILNSQRMSDMIAELKTRFDIIFFDSPPILGVSDGAVLASEVDQSIIIVQHRRFPRSMLQRVKQSISNVGGTVLGVVLNNVDLKHDPNYAYYTSYYDYYNTRDTIPVEPQAAQKAVERSAVAPAKASVKTDQDSSEY